MPDDPESAGVSSRVVSSALSLEAADQACAMDAIRDWSGLSSNETYMSRAMREDEVLQLANGGLIEVGAHTRHHPVLPQLSFESQRDEIQSSKRDLEALLGKKIAGFSYPNGRASVDAKRLVRETLSACTSRMIVRPGSDIYELTRFWHKNVDGDQFLQGLRLWMKMPSWRNRAQGS
jgi:peptidoglycan/xylan/chitin deacetylase (PgdA/CDA1 family)